MAGSHHCKLEFFLIEKLCLRTGSGFTRELDAFLGSMNKIVIPLFVLNRFSSTEERTLDLVRFDNFVMGFKLLSNC